MHSLIVETGKHKGKRLKVQTGESIVGRDDSAGVRIISEEVSRRHCLLISTLTELRVRDLNSSNGTFVNGRAIQEETVLEPGDLLVVGPMGFRLPAVEGDSGETKRLASQRKPGKPKDQGLSDDDIQALLGVGSEEARSDTDTAVIDLVAGAPPKTAQLTSADPSRPRKVFRSVAEEAADIIRRHKELNPE